MDGNSSSLIVHFSALSMIVCYQEKLLKVLHWQETSIVLFHIRQKAVHKLTPKWSIRPFFPVCMAIFFCFAPSMDLLKDFIKLCYQLLQDYYWLHKLWYHPHKAEACSSTGLDKKKETIVSIVEHATRLRDSRQQLTEWMNKCWNCFAWFNIQFHFILNCNIGEVRLFTFLVSPTKHLYNAATM